MKKLLLLSLSLLVGMVSQAQWTSNFEQNTRIASAPNSASEIYLSTNALSGDTYVQWCAGASNGWSPTLQRINFDGVPQWGEDGIHISGTEFASYSEGIAMTTTADGGVVSCFADYDGYTYAVKINADGTFAWGEKGIMLFDGMGFSRTEIAPGNDGGFWALGSDYNNSYVQYVNADGTLNLTNTISSNKKCVFGQLTVSNNNNVFVTYEKLGNGLYTDKEIHVVGFDTSGAIISDDVQLMAPQNFQSTYIHHVVPDGNGGGYVYIWHSALNDAFNTYVFHFDENGTSTISDPIGIPVHTPDYMYFYLDAYATVDPISHDLLIAYQQVDMETQTQNSIFINRISPTGERKWNDGIEILNAGNIPIGDLLIDAFEDGSGFSVILTKGVGQATNHNTIEALGFDMNGNHIWSTTVSSAVIARSVCENSTGYHGEQNIVVWTDATNGDLFGQNITSKGTLGPIPVGCPGPENFQGEYTYDASTQVFGAMFSWDEPSQPVDFYRLYRTNEANGEITEININGGNHDYFDEVEIGIYSYQLKAMYADQDCGFSLPATTPTGEDIIRIEVTSVQENPEESIVKVIKIYNMNGQIISSDNMKTLSKGIYIIQGMTQNGKFVTQKTYVD